MPLITTANFSAADAFYESLIETHRGLPVEASHALNARLVLLLANHIGQLDILREALRIARDTAPAEGPASIATDASAATDTVTQSAQPLARHAAPG